MGATIRWPDVYGNLFSSTKATSLRCTIRPSSSSLASALQKTQPGSSSADLMYSRRQGAHSRSVTNQACITPGVRANIRPFISGEREGARAMFSAVKRALRSRLVAVAIGALVMAGAGGGGAAPHPPPRRVPHGRRQQGNGRPPVGYPARDPTG